MAESMTNKERRLKLHKAICQCKKCNGIIDKSKLCPPCRALDDLVDTLKDESETP